ncbi:MAG TPA: malectin domain-containing carbohydrate-binding protein [Candidatus Limnocylindrales bacterium]|nr:malectin domain-containing carbohydrate-binding protein [Candidatus Limnocylindrales bacterium]
MVKTLFVVCIVFPLLFISFARAEVSDATNLDQGWRLWLDPKAAWQDDDLYLPEDVNLTNLPVNPPTGRWAVLNDQAGMGVSLPATVEEYYFNQAPARTAASTSPSDIVAADGYYQGVSWWYRPFTPPALRPGERLVFYFPGARLRAEVYVNGKLVGYNIISEAPFTADATSAIKPGKKNLLAVRITNPGGRLDWMDFLTMTWGKYTLPATHAFGGLAGGVEMQVRAPVSVSDLAVFNKPDPRSVRVQAEISSTGQAYDGPVNFSIARDRNVVFKQSINVDIPPGGTITTSIDATVTNSRLWDIDQPNLYQASATLPAVAHSDRSTTFGFRWLEVKGLRTDAKLYLNGRRIVPRSSISWGFWAPNGIFPDEAAAGREIAAMKALGLDSLQNHRHMPKAVVLDAFDRVGFLRYCEAGGGVHTFQDAQSEPPHTSVQVTYDGKPVELDFLNRYQLDKELGMIRAFRSHPCVSLWTLQNETDPDVNNPRMRYALEEMREADPSRIVLLKSGVSPGGQVWSLPYSHTWMKDDGNDYSGWWDEHTAMDSPGVWVDAMYKSPDDYKYYTDNRKEIVTWGEMATGASPDDHAAIVGWYKAHHQTGYDLSAHETILAAYNKFLDDHQFRPAFPTAETLFREAGAKHYFSAAHLLENARMCNAVDYIVLSGWESTTIDDHSGLVDSLRQLKADPTLIHQAAQPELLVIRPRHYVIATGDTAVVDVHQINEKNLTGSWLLRVTASMAGREPLFHADYPVELIGGETFGQLLKQDIQFKVDQPGLVTIHAALSTKAGGPPVLERDEPLLVIDPQPTALKGTIACCGESEEMIAAIKRQFNAHAVALSTNLGKVATILLATSAGGPEGWQSSYTDAAVANTDDQELYKHQLWGEAGLIHTWHGLTPGKATVKLYLDDGYMGGPGQRVFDVAINDTIVAKDLDIFAEAGGKDRALVETFVVDAPAGTIRLSVPHVTSDHATLAAVELRDSSGKVVRAAFRDEPYTDPAGNVWTPISQQNDDYWKPALSAAIERAQHDGTRVVLLTTGGGDAKQMAAFLAAQGLVTYSGPVGSSGPSWMGFWFFGRQHWLLAGLPSDCVLDWPYQIASGNGLMLSGSGVESVIGYGKNHDPNVGVAAAVVPCGEGKIVFLALPGLMDSFASGASGKFQPVTAKRLMFNALNQ